MARPYTPKVGSHVAYYNAAMKRRPATVIAVGSSNGGIVVRVGHVATYGTGSVGILQGPKHSGVAIAPNTWRPA